VFQDEPDAVDVGGGGALIFLPGVVGLDAPVLGDLDLHAGLVEPAVPGTEPGVQRSSSQSALARRRIGESVMSR
jgi:hypothetical protein